MKKTALILAVITLLTATALTVFVACENKDNKSDLNDRYACIYPAEPIENDNVVENELPPESFVGTVMEETTSYMIVEPNIDEDEYEISKRIRVDYITDHIDYLYGIGRKVVITYIPVNSSDAVFSIRTDDIKHNGFEEFEISVQYKDDSIPSRFLDNQPAGLLTHVASSREFDENDIDYNLYYHGLHDVYVTVDGDTLPLKEALTYGKVTLDGIIAECLRLKSIGEISGEEYDDGGSSLFDFGDYKIIKYHTLDGNRDVYIGTSDMDINAKNATAVCIGAYLWKDWGLRLEAKDVTPKGATIVFKQKGGNVTGELQTGEAFWIEKMDGNKWVAVDTLPLIDYAFNMAAYMVNSDGETELETEWEWLYNSLPKGKYRIAKEVMDFRYTGDYDKQLYYANFEICTSSLEGTVCFPKNTDILDGTMKIFDFENENIDLTAPGVKTDGFANTMPVEIRSFSEAITRAEKECTVEHDTTKIEFDFFDSLGTECFASDLIPENVEMYKINFSKNNTLGGDQTVYMDTYGVTKVIVYGE